MGHARVEAMPITRDRIHLVYRGDLGPEPSPLYDSAGRIVGVASEAPAPILGGTMRFTRVDDAALSKRLDAGAFLSVTRDGEPPEDQPVEASADQYTSYTRVGVSRSTSGFAVPSR